jgi:hypothetical protein
MASVPVAVEPENLVLLECRVRQGSAATRGGMTSTVGFPTLQEWTALTLRPVRRMSETGTWGSSYYHRLPRVGSGTYESLGLPHAVDDLAGHLGSTYVIGSTSQCLLDVLYFVHPRLIHRFV